MRFRQLKETSKASVGVYRSHIHGRGLFCKRDIEEGDMVIEYAGEVIRAVLADQREKRYEAMSGRRGVGGCYMFRIDDNLVVDATLKGNAARFINHSCDPNCYSRVVDIHGHKHILIFALRRITIGEELTYDYKFPFEEVKIPCTCGAKKCRKYLN